MAQGDTRAASGSVLNKDWDGTHVNVFGAKNEVVEFNLVLEAAKSAASNVSVSFSTLTGPGGAQIKSIPATGNGVFSWTNRNIELFYVRYLQIKGLSLLGYENYYDERHVPTRMRRPWTGAGVANSGTGWTDRPDHNKNYPEIAVPLELVPTFNIAQGQNQSIWADVFIPKTAAPGLYTGTVTISESGKTTYTVPVQLTVQNFALPDVPTAKTMINFAGQGGDIAWRYTGTEWPNPGDANDVKTAAVRQVHMLMAHRHKLSLMGDDMQTADAPTSFWIPALTGSMFSAANGYDGPGIGVGNNVYSIGTYGTWQSPWGTTQSGIQTHMNAWETWFEANSPNTERFVYLIDESSDYTQTEQWAGWATSNPGIGSKLPTMATVNLMNAIASIPDLTYPTTAAQFQPGPAYANAVTALRTNPLKKNYQYNGLRPATGCYMTEDDGVAMRVNAWAEYKLGIDRWFYWQSTYYDDYQNGRGQTDVFNNAQTFGAAPNATLDPVEGETSYLHSNGDGVLFYPGTDMLFPASSYGVNGPFASLRLKHWRRGVQDVDYLALANAINPTATQAIVNQMVPVVDWELGVDTLSDPTYVHANISWSTNPDDWENARAQLAQIIQGNASLKHKAKAKKAPTKKAKVRAKAKKKTKK